MSSYLAIHCARLQYLEDQIANLNLPPRAKILDLGCYPLYLFDRLSRRFDVYGVSSAHESATNPKITTLNLETDKLPYPDNHFDLIIFSEVLEHLTTDPTGLFLQVSRVLKPTGHFILTTPNVLRFQNIFNLIFGKNIYFPLFQLSQSIYHRHNREYTLSEIKTLLLDSKLKIQNSKFFIAYPPTRRKNRHDHLILKIVKYLNYLFMLAFPSRRDTLFVLTAKS